MNVFNRALFSGLLVLCPIACGDDGEDAGDENHTEHEEEAASPDCEAISQACHEVDTGEGKIAECHQIAHTDDAEPCMQEKDRCIALCKAAAGDGGTHDH